MAASRDLAQEEASGDEPGEETAYDAVVLAGGTSRRLGGPGEADKLALTFAGRTSLDRVLDALAGADHVVAVGPLRPTARHVLWVLEDPPGSGPARAVRSGVERTDADVVVVVAGDLPLLDAGTVERLVAALRSQPDADGAVLHDDEGREQLLAAAYRREPLREALRPVAPHCSLRRAVGGLRLVGVPDVGRVAIDCDTWDTVDAVRARLEPASPTGRGGAS